MLERKIRTINLFSEIGIMVKTIMMKSLTSNSPVFPFPSTTYVCAWWGTLLNPEGRRKAMENFRVAFSSKTRNCKQKLKNRNFLSKEPEYLRRDW